MKSNIEKLTLDESVELLKLETTIKTGKETFVKVGVALETIRDKKLYRKDYSSFEEYCQERWGFSRQYANQFIKGASVVQSLPKKVETMVSTIKQATALSKIDDPVKRVEVLKAAAKSGPVTAKSITAAARVIDATKEKFVPPDVILDEEGYKIPTDLVPMWLRRNEVSELLGTISEVKGHVKKALADNDPLYRELSEHFIVQMSNVYNVLKEAKPYAVCPSCNGRNCDKCRLCKGRGFLSSFKYNGPSVTEEMREMRRKMARK